MSVLIPVSRIADHCTPFDHMGSPWGVRVTRSRVAKALDSGSLYDHADWPYQGRRRPIAYHAGRIAYLVVNGWPDPIEIDVGCPGLSPAFWPSWIVLDGNHRLAAAIYRGDEFIAAHVAGDLDEAFDLFSVDCCEGIQA